MSSAMLFGTGFPGNVFNEFRTASCSELIDRYSSKVSIFAQTSSKAQGDESKDEKEPVEDHKPNPRGSFLLAYCNLISHQSPEVCDLRRKDFLRSAEVLPNMGKRVSFLDKETYEYWKNAVSVGDFDLLAAAVSFLDAHKALNELNFSSAFDDILFGLDRARESGCAVFEVFFLVLRASLERYWGLDDDAAESFEQANRAVPLNEDGKFCLDLVNLVSTGVDNDNAAPLARYYLYELTRLQDLQLSCNTQSEYPDFYASLFGATSYKSPVDSLSDYPENSVKWNSQYALLTPNQRLCYDISRGRSISIDGINIDSFILAPEQIAQQFSLSKESKTTFRSLSIFTCFDFFLKNTRSFVDLRVFKPLLLDWFKGGPDKDLDNFRTSGVAKGMLDAIIRLTCTRGFLQSRCRNLLFLLAFAREDLRRPELRDPNIAIALYRSIKCNDDVRKDFVMDVLEPICNRFSDADPQKVQEYEEILRQGTGELGVNSLFGNDSISSVLLNIYGNKPFETVELLEKFGENNVLEFLCRRDLETLDALLDISSHDEKEDAGEASESVESESGEKSLIRNMEQLDRYIWRVKDSVPERFIFIFNKPGHWDVEQYQERQAWYCVQTEETVYPLKLIEDWKSRNSNYKDAKVVIMLMSGVKLVRTRILPRLQNGCVSFFSLEKFKSAVAAGGSADNKTLTINDLLEYVDFSEKKNIPAYLCIAERASTPIWDLHRLYSEAMKGYTHDGHCYRIDNPDADSVFYNFGLSKLVKDYANLLTRKARINYIAQFRIWPFRLNLDSEIDDDGTFVINSVSFSDNQNYSESQFDVTGVCDDVVVHSLLVNGIKASDNYFRKILEDNKDNISQWRKPDNYIANIFLKQKKLCDTIAKNAIMTRNISHNLGSHVMAYLKFHLNSMQEMLRNKVFDQLFESLEDYESFLDKPQDWLQKKNGIASNSQKDNTSDRKNGNLAIDKVALPFLTGLGKFISYIQERQDFIATIATDYHPGYIPLNFKDYIYDELNIDKRVLRHKDRSGEVPDNILLGNIARSEGLYREHCGKFESGQKGHDIVLKFRTFNGDKPKKGSQEETDLNNMRGYVMNVPGGTTGRQAFFSIVENIIRNAAKHGKHAPEESLELTFNIYSVEDIENADAKDGVGGEMSLHEVFQKFYNKQDYYYVTITDNQIKNHSQLVTIRKGLADPYSKDGVMCDGYKGFKEMRICSDYLMNSGYEEYCPIPLNIDGTVNALTLLNDTKWDSDSCVPPTLYARLTNNSKQESDTRVEEGYLQFIFPMRRQMDVLVISDRVDSGLKEKLRQNNWSLMTSALFLQEKTSGLYSFFLVDDIEDCNLFTRLRPRSNFHMFSAKSLGIDITEELKEFPADRKHQGEILQKIKEKILWYYSDYNTGDVIMISDDKANQNIEKIGDIVDYKGEQLKVSDLIIEDEGEGDIGRFVYFSHYESAENFWNIKSQISAQNEKPRFIEGVSGANSTDRLIRCERLDFEWFCRHLHSAKQRIGVFDERLSDSILNGMSLNNMETTNYQGVVFADKNVWIFNIVDAGDGFVILGMNPSKLEFKEEQSADAFHTKCCKVATITMVGDAFKIIFNDNIEEGIGTFIQSFDRLSIHQGLLDKIYDKFQIKEQVDKKEEFTKVLYEAFAGSDKVIEEVMEDNSETKHYYLPGFYIHSGRSKPNTIDMPQRVPFIVFSLLEHSVLDCKHELVQLLDSVAYE